MTNEEAKGLADRMIAAVKDFVDRAVAPINTRLSASEVRLGAISMIAARGQSAESIAAFEALEARIQALEQAVKKGREQQ